MVNLETVLDDLLTLVKSTLAFQFVDEYGGEYDGESDWTEKHPSCLVEITGLFPQSKDAAKNTAASRVEFTLLVGAKRTPAKHPLELVSDLAETMEGQGFIYDDDGTYFAQLKSINLFARINETKIYALRYDLSV